MSRVLFITSKTCCPWAGESYRTRHTLEALVALGHEVDLLTIPAASPFRVQGVTTHLVPRLPFCKRLPEGASLRRGTLGMLMLFKAMFLARRARYDILHGVDDCGAVAWLVSVLTRRPFVYDIQGGGRSEAGAWFRQWTRKAAAFLGRLALRRADVIIGEHPDTAAELSQQGCGARVCVIPSLPALTGRVPAPVLNLARTRFRGIAARRDSGTAGMPCATVVTCVGGRDHFRGLTTFFNAVPYVLHENPDVRFVAVGGTAEEAGRMREALEQAEVAWAVTLTGRLSPEDLTALLMVSDILVAPCRTGEAVPMKVLDYLYMSKPIVVQNAGFSRTLFSSHNAMVVEAGHEALAQGILSLCRNPQLAELFAQKGHETLLVQHRTPEAFREALRQCYEYAVAN
ncbi:MAG: glycosyltransferase [Kiritimatiellaeota bacterium]|nr:glycosyltransferase [Kiritimatiellota bacterium]